jgi:hypothetical protein
LGDPSCRAIAKAGSCRWQLPHGRLPDLASANASPLSDDRPGLRSVIAGQNFQFAP